MARRGAWLDTLTFVEEESGDTAIARLKAGEIDIYFGLASAPASFETVKEDPDLAYSEAAGYFCELFFNPVGPTFGRDGALNPFSVPKIREAMNWLIDRDYIIGEFLGGLGRKKFLPIVSAFPDYARHVDVIRELEAKYGHDPEKAINIITEEMEALGAERVDGKWHFQGEPVVLIFIIRVEDERLEVGDYVATLLEGIGFTVDRQYKTYIEATPVWLNGDPNDGLWHLYTGGWPSAAIPRDESFRFDFFYTPRGLSFSPTWQAFQPSPEFDAIAERLGWKDFGSWEERAELFGRALRLSLEDSQYVWLYDLIGFVPRRIEVEVTADLAGGVVGALLWPYTLRRSGEAGGAMTIAIREMLVGPWNPIAAGVGATDLALIRATGDWSVLPDPFTGLGLPQRVESAQVTVQEGLPADVTLDWVSLEFVGEIPVPEDAWVDWDAAEERFISAGQAYTQTQNAKTKVVCRYPSQLFETKWHDGSSFSLGDVVMAHILRFDRWKNESAIFDPAAVPGSMPFVESFKGWRVAQEEPLVIETYADWHSLDAENAVGDFVCAFPQFGTGPGAWHVLALGVLAETAGELAFTVDKADALGVEHMSYISGPSLEVLGKYLEGAAAENYIPYVPTLGQYVTAEEAQARWANYQEWARSYGHYWVGNGPYYLESVFPVEGIVTFQRFADFIDPADKWSGYVVPRIAEVEMAGPGQVAIGSEASFDVHVTFEGQPYPLKDIAAVKYLLFDAAGELALSGEGTAVRDGLYQVVLGEEQTSGLVAGGNRLEVIVAPLVVSIPTYQDVDFVTAP
jgi:peptide/nickel transport system substrate-binding protein